MKQDFNLILSGLKFYDILTISQVLACAAVKAGSDVKTAEFTGEPLMSTEAAHIRIGKNIFSPLIEKKKADVIVCFEPAIAIDLVGEYLSPGGVIVINQNPLLTETKGMDQVLGLFKQLSGRLIRIDFTKNTQSREVENINFAILGILAGLQSCNISQANIISAVDEIIDKNDRERCFASLKTGEQYVRNGAE
jgi:indolepyruvate ferredoxin oxidoreductase beta subunit